MRLQDAPSENSKTDNPESIVNYLTPHKVYLLWELVDKPKLPTELVVDRETGLPLADQLPTRCHP